MDEKSRWKAISTSNGGIPKPSIYAPEVQPVLADVGSGRRRHNQMAEKKMRWGLSNGPSWAPRGNIRFDDDEATEIEDEMQASINGFPYPRPAAGTDKSRPPAILQAAEDDQTRKQDDSNANPRLEERNMSLTGNLSSAAKAIAIPGLQTCLRDTPSSFTGSLF